MKKLVLAISIIGLCSCGQQKTEDTQTNKNELSADLVTNPRSGSGNDTAGMNALPTMDFKDTSYDFGIMKEGETVTHDFDFTNNGKTPLIISSAKGSCGCTVPDYPHEPIQPGKTGTINVSFNSTDKRGHQEKSVTLVTNSNHGMQMLYIKAEVQDK